jgi:predicted amidohydrolase YtcJ
LKYLSMKTFVQTLAIFCCSALAAFAQQADLVVTNANIRTMDAKGTIARSMAVLGGRIIGIGSDADTKKLIGPKTRVIDAKGRLVLPGFNDAHVHFIATGAQLSQINLRDAKTPEEFVRRIREFAAKLPKGRWITGGRWDHENWTPADLPTAAMIDAATPNNPVFINRLDGHMALANSLAMRLARVGRNTADPVGGLIVRDAAGNATGIFKDVALDIIQKVIPPPGFDEMLEYAEAASLHAASLGVTSVQDMGTAEVAVYQEALKQGKLKTRMYGCTPIDDYERWKKAEISAAFGSPMLRVGCVKGYADGSLGSRTAWMFEPYADDPRTSGIPRDMKRLVSDIAAADKAGLQIMVHAIGDRANAATLDAYEAAAAANGPRDRRDRIEHSQHLRPQDIPRFGRLKVVASMQPIHLSDDGRWAGKRLGEKRLKSGAYQFRRLLDTGAVLAFGSDTPVASMNPLEGIYSAVTRRTNDDKNPNGWIPSQKITVDEAVRAFTYGSAYAEFQEHEKGTLEVGKLADFVIISDDIFSIDSVKIRDAKVLMTAINGEVVYDTGT